MAHGASSDRRSVQEVQWAIATKPDSLDVGFWRAAFGYVPASDDNAVDPLGHGSTVWMQELDPDKAPRHAMHVDVSVAREHAEARVAAAIEFRVAIAAAERLACVAHGPGDVPASAE